MALFSEATTIYLVRHGQTDWNIQRRMQGHMDIPLNDEGRAEAARLSEKLAEIGFDVCFSSDLQRASETAQILSRHRSLSVQTDCRLRERNLGFWEGRLFSEFLASLDLSTVEDDALIQSRVFPFLNEIALQHPGATILVVTHGGVLRNLLTPFLQDKRTFPFENIQVENGALLQLKVESGQYEIQAMEGIQVN